MAGAYFRGNKAEGFGFVITPATTVESDGFVSTVRQMLNDYDAAEAKPAVLLEQLESLCPRAVNALRRQERVVALGKICWLVTRDHLEADEHNGVMWAVEKVAP